MMISVLDRVENIVGKGENAAYQQFLFCFSYYVFRRLLQGHLKSALCRKRVNSKNEKKKSISCTTFTFIRN